MARHQIVPRLEDHYGNSLVNGEIRIYEADSLVPVEVFETREGGVALTQPLLTDRQGSVECWTNYAGEVDIVYSDGVATVDARGRRRPFTAFTETRRVGPARDVVVSAASGSAYDLNPDEGSLFDLTLDDNCVLSIGEASHGLSIGVQITQTAAFTLTWPAEVRWPDGVPPIASVGAGAMDIFVLMSLGGGDWAGLIAGSNL